MEVVEASVAEAVVESPVPLRELVEVEGWGAYAPKGATGRVEVLAEAAGYISGSRGKYLNLYTELGDGRWTQQWCNFPVGAKFKSLSRDVTRELREKQRNWQRNNLPAVLMQTRLTNFSGSDPEMFVRGSSGEVLPAWEYLPEKKTAAVYQKWSDAFCYWDGFQAELSAKADSCLAYLVDNIHAGMRELKSRTEKHHPGAVISPETVVEITQQKLLEAPQEFVELGCKPSLNAYGLMGEVVENPRMLRTRFAGGHYHFGKTGVSLPEAVEIVKMADAVVGMAAVGIFAEVDNPIRRRYYGLPGEFRMPSHGVEYRTLSNAWMCHPAVSHFVLGLTRKAMGMGLHNLRALMDGSEQEITQTILYSDVQGAREYVRRNRSVYEAVLSQQYLPLPAKHGLRMIEEGVQNVVEGWDKVEHNWKLLPAQVWIKHSAAAGCQWSSYAAR